MNSTRLRGAAPYIVLLLMAAVAVPIFFGQGWFQEMPRLAVYTGPLDFSGEAAMEDVRALATGFPGRVAGTRAARLSAEWVKTRFGELGLEARIDEFQCLSREVAVRVDQRTEVAVNYLTVTVPGYNVVAVSPGRLESAVVFGAHRDVAGDYQGAEDNASGTASLLELARVLTASPHEYTYVFVSYDGEEQGLRGSEAFIRQNPNLSVELSISLDMTGFGEANTVGFYPFVSSRSASPLWTVQLARSVSATNNLPIYQFGASQEISLNPTVTFWRVRKERLSSRVPTDTGPFVDRGIPSLGVFAGAVHGSSGAMGTIHGPRDVIDQVSAESLQMTGRYVEQYVKSLPLDTATALRGSRLYFVSQGRLLSPAAITWFTAYSCIVAAGFAVLAWRDTAGKYGLRSFAAFVRSEVLWIALALGLAAVSAGYPTVVRSFLSRYFTIPAFNVLWGTLTVLSMAAITFARQRTLSKADRPYHEWTAGQKALLNFCYILSFGALLALSGPFAALEASLVPILVLGRVNFRSQESRAGWTIAFIVWIAAGFFSMRGRVSNAAFNPVIVSLLIADFARIATWTLTAVFMLSAPRRGTRAEESAG